MTDPWENCPDEIFQARVKQQYLLSMRLPIRWAVTAYKLKRAADYLSAIAEEARSDFLERFRAEHEARKRGAPLPEPLSDQELIDITVDMDLLDIYFMLCGLAIENAAKGVLVTRDPSLVSNDGEFSRKYVHHDLSRLVENCGLTVEPREQEVLQALEEYVRWRARYPNRPKVNLPKRTRTGDFERRPQLDHRDREAVDRLVDRVYEFLNETMHPKQGTDQSDLSAQGS